ncbi:MULTISPECIES: hypothetical protein [Streptomyces]|uniref:Uncharacterized protein n=1 Tax=Streptomyces mordarskii TaxID=1226758 RepID=A0ABN1DWS4_9ACTN
MINETERPAAAAPFPLPALLARLEADRARAAQNAADTWRKKVARVFEGEEGAFRTAIEYTIHAFYGLEAAVAYHRNGALPSGSWRSGGGHTVTGPAGTPDEDPLDDGLREQYAEALDRARIWHGPDGAWGIAETPALTDAVLGVRDREMEKLRADRDRLASDFRRWMGRLSQKVLDERKRAEKAENAVADVCAECDAMEKAMSAGHASLHRLREHIGRIRDALGTREAS